MNKPIIAILSLSLNAWAGGPLDVNKITFLNPGSCNNDGRKYPGIIDVAYDGWVIACEKGRAGLLDSKIAALKDQMEKARVQSGRVDLIIQPGGKLWMEPSRLPAPPDPARLEADLLDTKERLAACLKDAALRTRPATSQPAHR